jgi:DHA1 family inner membrane transport protein
MGRLPLRFTTASDSFMEMPIEDGGRASNPYASPVPDPSAKTLLPPTPSRIGETTLLLTLSAVQFTSIVDFMVIMPLGPQLMRSLQITPDQFGMVVSSYAFAAGVAGLVASALVDRFSRRNAFLTLYAGFLVGTLCCALAPTYALLVLARIVTGAFGGVLGGIAMAIVGDVFPEERRGRATGALMSAFAFASVAGVPVGLYLGTEFGWHVPFLALVVLGVPVLVVGAFTLPPLRSHIGRSHSHPLRTLADTMVHPNHLKAFALIVSLMIGGFALIPFISPFLVANVGMAEKNLPWMYVLAGAATLFAAPLAGRLADRYGKLRTYRVIAPISAMIMLSIAFVPRGGAVLGTLLVAGLMVSNAGRMVAAMAMVTGSVEPQRRGGFMSANSSLQHIASGIGTFIGGKIIVQAADGRLQHMELVGLLAAGTTLASLWIAGQLKRADGTRVTVAESFAAAAEANVDAGEPLEAQVH